MLTDISSDNDEALFIPVSTLNRKRRIFTPITDNKNQKTIKENNTTQENPTLNKTSQDKEIQKKTTTNKEIFYNRMISEQNKIEQACTSKNNNQTNEQEVKKDRAPPITMIHKEHYNSLITVIKKENINIIQIKNKSNGLEILPSTSEDHRKLTKIFDYYKEEYFTFPLKEEKHLKIVIRGIPECIPIEEIKYELTEMKFEILSISRMNKKIDNQKIPMPLIFAELPLTTDSKQIFNITHINYLKIIVEPLRIKKTDIIQCHHCQGYGHTQTKCHLIPKCIKCLENHIWKDCPKLKTEEPRCTNCEGTHPANYKGCPIYKQLKENLIRKQNNNRFIKNPAFINQNFSYANITNRNSNNDQTTNPINKKPTKNEIFNLLINMQKTISSILASGFQDNEETSDGN